MPDAMLGPYGQPQPGWQVPPSSHASGAPPIAAYAVPQPPLGPPAAAAAGAPPGLSVPLTAAQAAALCAQLPALNMLTGCEVSVRPLPGGALHELLVSGSPPRLAGAGAVLARLLSLTEP